MSHDILKLIAFSFLFSAGFVYEDWLFMNIHILLNIKIDIIAMISLVFAYLTLVFCWLTQIQKSFKNFTLQK